MKVDLGLQVAATAFVEALTPLLAALDESGRPGGDPEAVRAAVVEDAWHLALGFIDADERATDEELWSLIVAFAPLWDRALLDRTPAELRAQGLTTGARRRLEAPSPLFETLLAGDRRHGTSASTTYYEHAVALGFMVASLDDHTDRNELLAIERYRGMLLAALRQDAAGGEPAGPAGAPSPPSTPPAGGTNTGTGAGSGTATGSAAPTVAATATTPGPDAPVDELPPARPLDDLLAELDRLVGLDAVKQEVKLVTNLLKVQQLRRERGLKVREQSRHLIFTGNPGTGKTTVARLLAQIYRTLGVVDRGHLVETDRAGLVAGFVGQTATKVTEVFDRADQGVLLIDEAYALVRGSDSDFGREAIDTIVKLVEDRRDRLVVIAAGYPDEMGAFVDANPGLRSRFPRTLAFPDYTTDELVRIFKDLCDDGGYLLDADAERRVRVRFEAEPRVKGFGNGRLARNLFEDAVARQAGRIVALADPTDIDLVLLLPPDIPELAARPDAAPAGGAGATADGPTS